MAITIVQHIFAPIYWLFNRFINNEPNPNGANGAPGASSGDSYKIFNQAEQESHKMVGENAGQPGFAASIRILVSSKTDQSAATGLYNLIAATSIFSDMYNNMLDNPQIIEDLFSFILTPFRFFAFKFKLIGVLQTESVFSTDELTSMYHFPDINYNKSPIIKWLDYKMLPPPHNLKQPKDPLMLLDYKRNKNGDIFTKDGTLLRVDENKNLLKDENKNLITVGGDIVLVYQDGENKGKPIDENKTPVQESQHRTLAGFPLYTDGVLMGWNEYRNAKAPVYFSRKDRGRHHYIIGKSG